MPTNDTPPDFDDFYNQVAVVSQLTIALAKAKNALRERQAVLIQFAKETVKINGRPPSDGYCRDVVAVVGLTEADRQELHTLRETIADLEGKLIEAKERLEGMRLEFFVWQSMMATKRKMLT